MNQRAELVNKIAKAASLQEQAAAVAELDAFDRQSREAAAQARSIDTTDMIIRETLRPVAVHERSTMETDWLGEVTASAEGADKEILVEASMWYRRLSPEVRADSEEFTEQARGMARRTASAHGDQAAGLEQQFLQYVAFLRSREGASGLPQVQQQVDSFENPAPTPLPQDTFDNFAPDIHPINQGVSGTETSERNPLLQEIVGEGQGQGQAELPNHHDVAPQITWDGITPTAAHVFDAPTVAISHSMNLDQFKAGLQAEAGRYCPGCDGEGFDYEGEHCRGCGGSGRVFSPEDIQERSSACGCPNGMDGEHLGDCGHRGGYAHDSMYGLDPYDSHYASKQAASGLPQVQQTVDSFENPAPTPLPTDVAYPWLLDGEEPEENEALQSGSGKSAAFQRRAAYVAGLVSKDPATLTDTERKEVLAFTASLQKKADQWSQSGPQYHGPDAANSPFTTPEGTSGTFAEGYSEGRSDWPNEAPTFADASPSVPEFVQGHVQGYQDAAQANPAPGAAVPGDLPRGAGNPNAVTHAKKVASKSEPIRVSASFTSPVEQADPEFAKAYKYATKWKPGKRLVSTGSAAFEAGLYAGMSDNAEHQEAWVAEHRRTASAYKKPEYLQRLSKHREFSKKASRNLDGFRVVGAYLKPKTAGTAMDLDTMGPTTAPSPTGQTPINGPGTPGPLAGGQDAAAPGGPAPYNGAEPYGAPVVPNGPSAHGTPTAIDTTPGGPVDKAAFERLSPQTLAFRKTVQANLLKTAAEKKVPVCNGCGEAFDSRETANEAHGKSGCGSRDDDNTGYTMTRESEAF